MLRKRFILMNWGTQSEARFDIFPVQKITTISSETNFIVGHVKQKLENFDLTNLFSDYKFFNMTKI